MRFFKNVNTREVNRLKSAGTTEICVRLADRAKINIITSFLFSTVCNCLRSIQFSKSFDFNEF